jgi:hypothetical protein
MGTYQDIEPLFEQCLVLDLVKQQIAVSCCDNDKINKYILIVKYNALSFCMCFQYFIERYFLQNVWPIRFIQVFSLDLIT